MYPFNAVSAGGAAVGTFVQVVGKYRLIKIPLVKATTIKIANITHLRAETWWFVEVFSTAEAVSLSMIVNDTPRLHGVPIVLPIRAHIQSGKKMTNSLQQIPIHVPVGIGVPIAMPI